MAVPIRLAPEEPRRRFDAAPALIAGSSSLATMADTLVRIDHSLTQAAERELLRADTLAFEAARQEVEDLR